jgi:hypothetical protein
VFGLLAREKALDQLLVQKRRLTVRFSQTNEGQGVVARYRFSVAFCYLCREILKTRPISVHGTSRRADAAMSAFLREPTCDIGAYAGFAYLSAAFGSVRASLMMYVSPIAAIVLSILFLGEGPALYHLLGGLLVLAGVWLTVRK